MPEPLAITVTDPLTFDEAVAVLCRYSLIERRREAGEGAGGDEVSGKGMLSMHRLVQVVARDWLAVEERQKWAEVAVRVVANIFPLTTDRRGYVILNERSEVKNPLQL